MLAVRPTPVAASNAPKDTSAAAAVKTFIVSLVPTGDSKTAPSDPGHARLRLSMGAEYAGRKATVYVKHEDGTFDVLLASVDADGVVSVSTGKLSRYTVVVSEETAGAAETPSATTTTASVKPDTASKPAATTKPAAAHAAASESLPQTGDLFGATSAVLAALGALTFFEAKHLRRET